VQADQHCRNNQLTVSEMRTFLKGTRFESFGNFLSAPRIKDKVWKMSDIDNSGTIDFGELEAAVRAYVQACIAEIK